MSKRRVVITGLGIISPVGSTVSKAWDNIVSGKSGITRITRFDASAFSSQIAGEVDDFDINEYLPVKEARRMDIFIHYGMAAATQSIKDAGIEDISGLEAERIGVNIGSGIGGLPMIENTDAAYHKGGPRKISPFFIPSTIINMISGNLSIKYGYKGPNIAIVTACTTATHSIGSAARMIEYDDADIMICGGAESCVTPLAIGGFAAAKALSVSNDNPEAEPPMGYSPGWFYLG